MRKTKSALAALILALPLAANAVPILDQAFEPAFEISARVGTIPPSTFDVLQSFTVGVNGLLDSIDVAVGRGGSPTEDLILEVIAGNDPLGSAISARALMPSDIPTFPSFVSFDVNAAGLFVAVGDLLSFRLTSSQDFTRNVNEYVAYGSLFGGYAGGVGDHIFDGVPRNRRWDFAFRTYVDPDAVQVSEPSALVLLGIGLAGIGLTRRRRKA